MAATFPVMSGGIIWQTALFDNWNPLRCVDHAGQPLHLDGTGNLVTQTDANGNTTRYTYDSLNRLVGQSDGESGDGPLQQCGRGTRKMRTQDVRKLRRALSKLATIAGDEK